jgi:ferredoxin-type protein NapF
MATDFQRRAFFMTGQTKKVNSDLHLPWLKSAENFLDKCTQCEACIKSCPESIIEKGDGGFPTVNFKRGECTYCQACAKSCPESLFDIEQPEAWNLDLAINNTCFTERNIVCQSCRDACEAGAISFSYAQSSIPKPKVDASLCTSCGACVSSCPANAISLLPSEKNKIVGTDKGEAQ